MNFYLLRMIDRDLLGSHILVILLINLYSLTIWVCLGIVVGTRESFY